MVCQDCKKREAQVHLTQIVNNEKLMLSLCRECAAARGFNSPLDNMPFPLAEILAGLAKDIAVSTGHFPTEPLECAHCKLTFDEFTKLGRFGCGRCYAAFRPRLESIMRKIHGAAIHRGKNPNIQTTGFDNTLPVKEEERLEARLRKAIEDEDFERAAELRDKLRSVKESFPVDK
ncbi:MAG: UvrB/UvrC motif-containing protein [candidate division Zixibacteria bacterium]|nr:UvrB/UvrC motif-containing protein [candidate division Zixibacteria bacterium]